MHNPIIPALIAASLQCAASLPLVPNALAQDRTRPPADSILVLADPVFTTGQVETIDQNSREMGLRGEDGRMLVMKVDPSVSGFEQIVVGDRLKVEVIEPTAVSIASVEPASGKAQSAGAKWQRTATIAPRDKPAGVDVATVRITATIDDIDYAKRWARLKSPEGILQTVHIADRIGNIERFRKGDTVVLCRTEAVAISVSK